jgi:hypothetical protein
MLDEALYFPLELGSSLVGRDELQCLSGVVKGFLVILELLLGEGTSAEGLKG